MEILIRWVLLIAAMGLTVQTARPHLRCGDWLDASWTFEIINVPIPFGMGAIMVLLHVGKVMLPAVAASFWRRALYVRCALAVLLFPMLVIVSITSTLAFLDLQHSERSAQAPILALVRQKGLRRLIMRAFFDPRRTDSTQMLVISLAGASAPQQAGSAGWYKIGRAVRRVGYHRAPARS